MGYSRIGSQTLTRARGSAFIKGFPDAGSTCSPSIKMPYNRGVECSPTSLSAVSQLPSASKTPAAASPSSANGAPRGLA